MVEWYYVLGAYLGGFILYLVSGALFYRVRFLMIIIFRLFMIQIDQNDKTYSYTKKVIWHLAIWHLAIWQFGTWQFGNLALGNLALGNLAKMVVLVNFMI